jgi:hypothetical protein
MAAEDGQTMRSSLNASPLELRTIGLARLADAQPERFGGA